MDSKDDMIKQRMEELKKQILDSPKKKRKCDDDDDIVEILHNTEEHEFVDCDNVTYSCDNPLSTDYSNGIKKLDNWAKRYSIPLNAKDDLISIISENFHDDGVLALEHFKPASQNFKLPTEKQLELTEELNKVKGEFTRINDQLNAMEKELELKKNSSHLTSLKILTIVMNTHQLVKEGPVKQMTHNNIFGKIFPLKTVENLIQLEKDLVKPYFEEDLKKFLKELKETNLNNKKSVLTYLFTDSFLYNFNWDGVQNKDALKKYKFFDRTLFEAWHTENFYKNNYILEIRNEIRASRMRYYKKHRNINKK